MSKKPLGLGLVSSIVSLGGSCLLYIQKEAWRMRQEGVPYVVCCKTQALNVC
jgi:hypothetical protein